jgi:hypothetical protein
VNTQQRRLNPLFGSVGLFSSDNNSNYQSLRLNIEKRLSHGFTITANYTRSRMFDDQSPSGSNGRIDPFNRRLDYGISSDDVPNLFNFTSAWQIPALPLHGLSGKLINGWEVSNIISWRSGFPFSIFSNVDNSLTGVGSDRADYIGGPAALDAGRSHGQLVQQYFNAAVFVPNLIGTFGNTGKNILRGPRFFNTDVALLKNFTVTERIAVQFRSEFFNIFNNVNFAQPQNYLGTSSFGQITSVLNGGTAGSPGEPRIIQFALKLLF